MPPKKKTETFNAAAFIAAEGAKFKPLDKPPELKVVPKRMPVKVAKRTGKITDVVVEQRFTKLPAWSLSAYKDYMKCPRACALKRISKIKEPDSPAMARGTFAHSVCEKFLKGEIPWKTAVSLAKAAGDKNLYGEKAQPIDLLPFKEYLHDARKTQVVVEGDWAFKASWDPCDWFASPWLRMKLDLGYKKAGRYVVSDWKTGRIYDDHQEEEDLYVLAVFLMFEDAQEVSAEFGYLDQGVVKSSGKVYQRDEMSALADKWEKKVRPMMNDTTFPCKPNRFCGYCHYRSANSAALPGGKQLCRF